MEHEPEWVWQGETIEETGPECPVYLGREFEEFFVGWAMLEKGFLPLSGGWEEQPRVWIQAFEAIGAAVARVHREHHERLKAEAENNGT